LLSTPLLLAAAHHTTISCYRHLAIPHLLSLLSLLLLVTVCATPTLALAQLPFLRLLLLLLLLRVLTWQCCTPESASSPSSSASSEALEAAGSSPSPLRGARWFSCKHQQQRDTTKHSTDQQIGASTGMHSRRGERCWLSDI
jgi:hypothetical protein